MQYRRLSPHLIIKHGIHGEGVFATDNFKKGEVLFRLKGSTIDHPTRTSVQVGKRKHVENIIAGHVNHNCHPNAKVSKRSQAFVSARNIEKGEEITFDYNKNEDMLACPFKCGCCGKKIVGKQLLSTHTGTHSRKIIKRKYNRHHN